MVESTDYPAPLEDEEPEEGLEDASPKGEDAQPAAEADEQLTAAVAGWTEALRSVQKSINEATAAISFLRETIQQMAPLLRSLGGLEEALRGFEMEQPQPQRPATSKAEPVSVQPLDLPVEEIDQSTVPAPPAVGEEEAPLEQTWGSWKRKPTVREKPIRWTEPEEEHVAAPTGPPRASLKPITLVPDAAPAPYSYKVTVGDLRKTVELVALHQALGSVPSIRNLSLLSYANGVASLTLEATEELQPPELESAIHKTLKRSCNVLPHDANTILIKMQD